jgi:probable HAF family extracellular repeat protein
MKKEFILVLTVVVVLAGTIILISPLIASAQLIYDIIDLGDLPGGDNRSYAEGINDNGQVVGWSTIETYGGHAFLWDIDNGMQDLGCLPGGTNSYAEAINNNGQVVGWSPMAEVEPAFLWDADNGMQDLGCLPGGDFSYAESINDNGQVVGHSYTDTGIHAFLWDPDNGMQDLNNLLLDGSDWVLRFATGINTHGQIVGYGFIDGNTHAFLMTPIPEPSFVVNIDIKPASCPNPLNVKSKGMLAVAILGSQDFDVNTIDILSVRLDGVAPVRGSYEDVGTVLADANECECTTEGPDGYPDLTLKFKTEEIAEALGEVIDGEEWILQLTGVLHDDTPIEGEDCIVIRSKSKNGK